MPRALITSCSTAGNSGIPLQLFACVFYINFKTIYRGPRCRGVATTIPPYILFTMRYCSREIVPIHCVYYVYIYKRSVFNVGN